MACSLAVVLTLVAAAPATDTGFVNLDFEAGKKPWRVWYSDSPDSPVVKYPYQVDTSVSHRGKASVRITATARGGRAYVHQTTERFTPGARYELSYWLKVSSPAMAGACQIDFNLRKPRPDGKGLTMRKIRPIPFAMPGKGGWVQRRAVFTIDKDAKFLQIGLDVHDTTGAAWFDDIRIRALEFGAIRVLSMYDYYPVQVKLQRDMARRYGKLASDHSPFLSRAKVYNRLLVDVARLTEDARRLDRSALYASALGRPIDVARDTTQARKAESELDRLYQLYGRRFVARESKRLSTFDRGAERLQSRVRQARKAIANRLRSIQAAVKAQGHAWSAPPEPRPRPVVITPDGKPNQIVIGTRSPSTHFRLEDPLTINKLHSLSMIYDLPKCTKPGQYDFPVTFMLWKRIQGLGAEQASIATALGLHDVQMAPAWFIEKCKADPDLVMRSADGHAPRTPHTAKYSLQLNTWRPEVREMTRELISHMGRTFRTHPEFLWYVVGAENLGPYFSLASGVRSTGYNRSALPDFHAWLKERYGRIGELNRLMRTSHKAFDAIRAPQDLCIVKEWKRPHPLGYEFQAWREDRHVRWQKLIYDALKRADPTKPVFASTSRLLASLDGSRLFDTCDIMGFHTRAPHFMLGSIYTHSLNRFAKKQLGQYECF
jgi:glycosyl hydrolase family 42 (putative beta-galactosidase)/carbohydrate binding protein with CBM4/9 domain